MKKVSEQTGDPRFLEQVQKCISGRRALLGLDAPTKIAPTSPNGEEAYHSHVMSQLMRLAEQSTVGPIVVDGGFIERGVNRVTDAELPTSCSESDTPSAMDAV